MIALINKSLHKLGTFILIYLSQIIETFFFLLLQLRFDQFGEIVRFYV
jgi:hypothetical protein